MAKNNLTDVYIITYDNIALMQLAKIPIVGRLHVEQCCLFWSIEMCTAYTYFVSCKQCHDVRRKATQATQNCILQFNLVSRCTTSDWRIIIFALSLSLWKGCFLTPPTTPPTIHLNRMLFVYWYIDSNLFFDFLFIYLFYFLLLSDWEWIINQFNSFNTFITMQSLKNSWLLNCNWFNFRVLLYCCQKKHNCVLSTTCCFDDKHLLKYSTLAKTNVFLKKNWRNYKFSDSKSKNGEFQFIDLWFRLSITLNILEWGDPKNPSLRVK